MLWRLKGSKVDTRWGGGERFRVRFLINLTRRDLSKFVSMRLIDTLTHTSPSKHVKRRET